MSFINHHQQILPYLPFIKIGSIYFPTIIVWPTFILNTESSPRFAYNKNIKQTAAQARSFTQNERERGVKRKKKHSKNKSNNKMARSTQTESSDLSMGPFKTKANADPQIIDNSSHGKTPNQLGFLHHLACKFICQWAPNFTIHVKWLPNKIKEKSTLKKPLPKVTFASKSTLQQTRYSGGTFYEDGKGFVHAYSDGGYRQKCASIGGWFGPDHPCNISKIVSMNNSKISSSSAAELKAAFKLTSVAIKCGVRKLLLHTDSETVISTVRYTIQFGNYIQKQNSNSIEHMPKQIKNLWFIEGMMVLIQPIGPLYIRCRKVKAHSGIQGNEEADRLAEKALLNCGCKPRKNRR